MQVPVDVPPQSFVSGHLRYSQPHVPLPVLMQRPVNPPVLPSVHRSLGEPGIVEGDLAFRQHAGGHTVGPNWPILLTFASRYWDAK